MNPVGLLNAEKLVEAVLLYVFSIAFIASLLCFFIVVVFLDFCSICAIPLDSEPCRIETLFLMMMMMIMKIMIRINMMMMLIMMTVTKTTTTKKKHQYKRIFFFTKSIKFIIKFIIITH